MLIWRSSRPPLFRRLAINPQCFPLHSLSKTDFLPYQ